MSQRFDQLVRSLQAIASLLTYTWYLDTGTLLLAGVLCALGILVVQWRHYRGMVLRQIRQGLKGVKVGFICAVEGLILPEVRLGYVHVQRTRREHVEDTQRTCREHAESTQRAHRGHALHTS